MVEKAIRFMNGSAFTNYVNDPAPTVTEIPEDQRIIEVAARLHRIPNQLFALGLTRAELRELPFATIEARVSKAEEDQREAGIIEPKAPKTITPPKAIVIRA